MLSEVPYATFANFSPRGDSQESIKSQRACGQIKRGHIPLIDNVMPHLRSPENAHLNPFFADDVSLVPAPRSAPLMQNALWPSKIICDRLREANFGKDIVPCINRTKVIRSSTFAGRGNRPDVAEHLATLAVEKMLLIPAKITLVDDVLTKGSTAFACALKLHEAFPEAEIRVFAVFRTMGFVPNIEKLVDPSVGKIEYNHETGWIGRSP